MMYRLALLTALIASGCVEDRPAQEPVTCGGVPTCTGESTCVADQCVPTVPSGDFQYAAEAFAPTGRPDIVMRAEIPDLPVGTTPGAVSVVFTPSIVYSGRVTLHSTDALSTGARIVFHRASRIPGAPDYEISANSMPGVVAGQAAFSVRLPPNLTGETYDISVYPDDGTLYTVPDGQSPPSALAPPVTFTKQTIKNAPSTPVTLTCDSAGLREMRGTVLDALGNPMRNLLVRAYSKPQTTSDVRTLISSTGTTDASGSFSIFIPVNRTVSFDLDVSPNQGVVAPTLTRVQPVIVSAGQGADLPIQIETIDYPFFPAPASFTLPVTYKDLSGVQMPAAGAHVIFVTAIASTEPSDTVRFTADAIVDDKGRAALKLIPGDSANRSYTVSILPPPMSKNLASWDTPVQVGTTGGVLAASIVGLRTQISGRLLDAGGKPAANVTVRPQISSDTGLMGAALDRVSALSFFEGTTMSNGTFTLYLDPKLVGADAFYELQFLPPGGSALPQWSVDKVTATASVTPSDFRLPSVAVASGTVTGGDSPVVNAEVHIYAKMPTELVWKLRTVGHSDDNGKITLIVPSVPPSP